MHTGAQEIIMRKPFNLIAELLAILSEYGVKAVFHFDRLHLYTDAATDSRDLEWVCTSDPENNRVTPRRLPHHPDMSRMVWLSQPNKDKLIKLSSVIKGNYRINRVELAFDFYSDDRKALARLRKCLLRMLVFKKRRKDPNKNTYYYCNYKNTIYLTPSADKCRMVLYRRKDQNTGKRCLHLELRLSGVEQLRRRGIETLDEMISFDHQDAWNTSLDIRKPNLTSLGKILSSKAESRQGLIKTAKTWLSRKGTQDLQEILAENPSLETAFERFTTGESLRKFVASYMEPPLLLD
jgi:hypothetical protein